MAVAKPSGVMTYPAHRLRGGSVVSRAVHHLNVEAAVRRGEDPDGVNDSSSVFSGHGADRGAPVGSGNFRVASPGQGQAHRDRAPVAVRGEAGAKDLPRGVRGVGGCARRAKGGGDARQDPRRGGGSGGNNADEDEDEEIDGEELGVFDETDLEDDLDVNDDDETRRMTTATSGSSTSSTSPGRSEWSTPPSVRFFQLSYGQLE